MTAPTHTTGTGAGSDREWVARDRWDADDLVEHTTETRRSTSTSEFWIFLVLSVAMLFFAYDGGDDSFSREDGWRFVTALAVGYFLSRGLAKVGSYETFDRGRHR